MTRPGQAGCGAADDNDARECRSRGPRSPDQPDWGGVSGRAPPGVTMTSVVTPGLAARGRMPVMLALQTCWISGHAARAGGVG